MKSLRRFFAEAALLGRVSCGGERCQRFNAVFTKYGMTSELWVGCAAQAGQAGKQALLVDCTQRQRPAQRAAVVGGIRIGCVAE
jgi:hypothetical protein